MFNYLREAFIQPYSAEVASKDRAILHFGYVTYEDVFGDTHQTNFAFYHWGEELSDLTALRCRLGNSAT